METLASVALKNKDTRLPKRGISDTKPVNPEENSLLAVLTTLDSSGGLDMNKMKDDVVLGRCVTVYL